MSQWFFPSFFIVNRDFLILTFCVGNCNVWIAITTIHQQHFSLYPLPAVRSETLLKAYFSGMKAALAIFLGNNIDDNKTPLINTYFSLRNVHVFIPRVPHYFIALYMWAIFTNSSISFCFIWRRTVIFPEIVTDCDRDHLSNVMNTFVLLSKVSYWPQYTLWGSGKVNLTLSCYLFLRAPMHCRQRGFTKYDIRAWSRIDR